MIFCTVSGRFHALLGKTNKLRLFTTVITKKNNNTRLDFYSLHNIRKTMSRLWICCLASFSLVKFWLLDYSCGILYSVAKDQGILPELILKRPAVQTALTRF